MSCPLAGHRIGLLQGEAKRKRFLATIAKTICYNIGMIPSLEENDPIGPRRHGRGVTRLKPGHDDESHEQRVLVSYQYYSK